MKLIPSFGEIKSKAKSSLKRFPIVISWVIIGTLFTINIIETESFRNLINQKVIMTFVLGVSWLISSRFFIEQFKKDKEWISVITICLLLLFNLSLTDQNDKGLTLSSNIRFWLYIVIGHISILVAPFLFHWHKNSFFNYIKNIAIAIFRSAFFSLIIYGGISLALLAIEHLFDYKIKGERYLELFVICLGVVNTWIYLSDFPKNIYSETKVAYTKPLEVLIKYILIPLLILYLIILYAYMLKIVFQWNLPKGWVSYLVIALSFLGFIVQMLINPIQKTIKSRTINKFFPWFYYLLLPLISLLFIAIFRRIFEYGFTENRYLVLCLSIWVLAMTLYMLISKRKEIRFFSLLFIGIFLITSFGFWGIFCVSNTSQLKRFEISFNTIKQKDFKVTKEEKNQFQDITQFLYERNQLEKVTPILGFNPIESFKDVKWSWSMSNKISDTLNIKITDIENTNNFLYGKSFFFNLDNETISVKEYDFFKQLYFSSISKQQQIKNYSFSLDKTENILRVYSTSNKKVFTINFDKFIESLLQKDSENRNRNLNEMTLLKEFEELKIKIIFSNLNLSQKDKESNNIPQINNTRMYVFIKEK